MKFRLTIFLRLFSLPAKIFSPVQENLLITPVINFKAKFFVYFEILRLIEKRKNVTQSDSTNMKWAS